ncbi:phasin family protein [Rhodomicrobium sp. Az07]|uniref:phasin family protein n=1 Tax=Rhodomicrobium sp. Az07 TaxID=2839034 RepID=UPI001BEBEAB0|nr:phasin family protein [Rhodomicrobium sp. Az07]MBT3069919.1 phasin family protein [Rhodomicrobium sp. Az07]
MTNTPNFGELPDSVRNILKTSIEQAQRAFDSFASSSEKLIQGVDTSSVPAGDSLKQLNEKMAAFTRQNADANFNLALKLTEAKHLSEIVELQNAHLRDQMEAFSRQLEELRELTVKTVKEGSRAATQTVQQAANSAPSNPFYSGN